MATKYPKFVTHSWTVRSVNSQENPSNTSPDTAEKAVLKVPLHSDRSQPNSRRVYSLRVKCEVWIFMKIPLMEIEIGQKSNYSPRTVPLFGDRSQRKLHHVYTRKDSARYEFSRKSLLWKPTSSRKDTLFPKYVHLFSDVLQPNFHPMSDYVESKNLAFSESLQCKSKYSRSSTFSEKRALN